MTVKLICEKCGKIYGTFCGSVGLEGSDVFIGVCFNCEYDERGETAGPLDEASCSGAS